MNDFIATIEEHTNSELIEDVAQASLISSIIVGIIYCVALLL